MRRIGGLSNSGIGNRQSLFVDMASPELTFRHVYGLTASYELIAVDDREQVIRFVGTCASRPVQYA